MTCQDITNQQELDHALAADAVTCVHINSERGVWLRLGSTDKDVRAYGNATVEADGNATVEADGNATVRADGNATVRAYGNATVEADGNATVRADGNATVRAYGNATVEAGATSSVHAYRSNKIVAGSHVAVFIHNAQAQVTGGVVIDVSQLNLDDAATWADHHGVQVADGRAVLYKAADEHLTAGQDHGMPTIYTVGANLVCTDWEDSNECGGGLHLSPATYQATSYRPDAKRWLRCSAAVEDVRPINDGTPKCKVRALRVEAEVDRLGRDLPANAEVTS